MSKPLYKNVALIIIVIFLLFLVVVSAAVFMRIVDSFWGSEEEAEGDIEGCLYPFNFGNSTAWVLLRHE